MSSLRALHVRYAREPLPTEIVELAALETLDAGGWGSDETCRIGTLPDQIGKLAKLRTLAVRQLVSWPDSLRDCRALEHLDCGSSAPPFLHELTSLRRASGPIEALVQLPNLEELEMSGAKRVPPRLAEHGKLRTVRWWAYDLEDDYDAALEHVLALPSLESLELAYIPRTTLPRSLLKPPLRTLRLGITDRNMPGLDLAALCTLLSQSRIEHLALRTDKPVVLPEELGDVGSLRELELSGLGFAKLPGSIGKLARLRRIQLRQTKVGAPERKRLRAALPGCRVTVSD
jgi:Leucine-rich repeat (LRR) protein